jgi:membrane-associated phospholipid phosphatase
LTDSGVITEEARHRFFVLHRHTLILAGALLTAGLILTLVIKTDPEDPPVQAVDDQWLEWMVALRVDVAVEVAKFLSFLGDVVVLVPLRLLACAVLVWRRWWLQLSAFVLAIVSSELMIGPVKGWVDRPRPPDPLVETTLSSYPSGHAIAAAVTAFALVVVFLPARPNRLRVIGLAATFAAMMALSRTYLSAHWLTDVVGGALLGVGLALFWPAAFELIRERQRVRASPDEAAPSTVP